MSVRFIPFPPTIDNGVEESSSSIEVYGTSSAVAANAVVGKAFTGSAAVITGASELVGVRGKAYVESGHTFTNAAGFVSGVVATLKVVGTTSAGATNVIVAQVHADSTQRINSLFKGVDSGSGQITSLLDFSSIASADVDYFCKFKSGSTTYGLTLADLAAGNAATSIG